MVPIESIERYPFFSFLKPEKLKDIAAISILETLEKGAVIFREKQPAAWLYILVDGHIELFYTVEVEYHPELSKELHFGEVVPGEIFGISALVEPYILTSTARATVTSQVIKISADRLRACCNEDDQLAYGFMKQVAKATIKRLNATLVQLATIWDNDKEYTKSEAA